MEINEAKFEADLIKSGLPVVEVKYMGRDHGYNVKYSRRLTQEELDAEEKIKGSALSEKKKKIGSDD
jgi:hypothetical protein